MSHPPFISLHTAFKKATTYSHSGKSAYNNNYSGGLGNWAFQQSPNFSEKLSFFVIIQEQMYFLPELKKKPVLGSNENLLEGKCTFKLPSTYFRLVSKLAVKDLKCGYLEMQRNFYLCAHVA